MSKDAISKLQTILKQKHAATHIQKIVRGQMVAEFIIDDFINPEAVQKLQTISERKQHQPNPLAAEEDPNPKQPHKKIKKTKP